MKLMFARPVHALTPLCNGGCQLCAQHVLFNQFVGHLIHSFVMSPRLVPRQLEYAGTKLLPFTSVYLGCLGQPRRSTAWLARLVYSQRSGKV